MAAAPSAKVTSRCRARARQRAVRRSAWRRDDVGRVRISRATVCASRGTRGRRARCTRRPTGRRRPIRGDEAGANGARREGHPPPRCSDANRCRRATSTTAARGGSLTRRNAVRTCGHSASQRTDGMPRKSRRAVRGQARTGGVRPGRRRAARRRARRAPPSPARGAARPGRWPRSCCAGSPNPARRSARRPSRRRRRA